MTRQLWTSLHGEEQTILFPVPTHCRVIWENLTHSCRGTESWHAETIIRFMEAPDFTPECVSMERLTEWETETTTTL